MADAPRSSNARTSRRKRKADDGGDGPRAAKVRKEDIFPKDENLCKRCDRIQELPWVGAADSEDIGTFVPPEPEMLITSADKSDKWQGAFNKHIGLAASSNEDKTMLIKGISLLDQQGVRDSAGKLMTYLGIESAKLFYAYLVHYGKFCCAFIPITHRVCFGLSLHSIPCIGAPNSHGGGISTPMGIEAS
jgi:hypothetical protein